MEHRIPDESIKLQAVRFSPESFVVNTPGLSEREKPCVVLAVRALNTAFDELGYTCLI